VSIFLDFVTNIYKIIAILEMIYKDLANVNKIRIS